MAIESRVNADDDWFVGEDREWQFRFVEGDTSDVPDWTMELAFYPRRARDNDAALLTVTATGVTGGFTQNGPVDAAAVCTVTAANTFTLGAGYFQFVLRRVDPGRRSVLAFGSAELRSAVNA